MKINRNTLWAETFVNELVESGIKYACVSPGSRNTSLTLAFAGNKNIKSFVHIDERSSAFFALGLAKVSGSPVAIVTTSGTATAELYPAIIEAYQQRVPLIVCTADRPPEMLNRGANQTINQNNLYKNHICWFFDAGLPEPNGKKIKHIKALANRAVFECCIRSRGPVHLNFPFRKPFEPYDFTDDVSIDLIEYANLPISKIKIYDRSDEPVIKKEKWFIHLYNYVRKFDKGLIFAGPENYNLPFHQNCLKLSNLLGYPLLADGASQLRFGQSNDENLITNYDAVLRSKKFSDEHNPEIILQFGRTATSKALEDYFERCNSLRFMINEFGDWFDPSNKANEVYACKPFLFCEKMNEQLEKQNFIRKTSRWLNEFKDADKIANNLRVKIIEHAKFPNEGRVIKELIDALPDDLNLMLSNSMPVRDFDYFAPRTDKKISVFNNRGASGIDGITSTALGILADSGKPTLLLTGDMAFYYDLNGLLAAKKYSLPLVIVLINNDGGGIFEVLPISAYGKVFKEYFIASHHLDFAPFVKGYGGNYKLIQSWEDFSSSIKKAFKQKKFTVLELKTYAKKSLKNRRLYWAKTAEALNGC